MKKGKITLALTIAVVVSAMVGYFGISYAMDNVFFRQENYKINEKGQLISADNNELITEENFDPSKVYRVNENGLTYGSALFAVSVETEPDLILARGVNGIVGYVYATDLYGEAPKNPEEALAMQKANTGQERVIPLYASNGKTVIGDFKMLATEEVNLITAEEAN